ncbi:DUF6179 domain-containing protein [Desnuesiella massiliensis]|uniref:DUF6179 domain-containing protein n=1 Tax=Desnuesiella massiliensis TaxID=1650662 RepID=UPI0006E2DB94|nr:DUF6179 domain-containing protein [Desnuesiella massiliensis]
MMDLNIENSLQLTNEEKINVRALNKNQYIISLLKEAMKCGAISNKDVLDIQIRIMEVLKELIMKYTKGESTSVTVEVTEGLLNSLLYSLDFYLIELDAPQAALRELKEKDIRTMYEKGIELLRLCVIDTKKLYEKIKRNRLQVELEAYNLTIDEAIPCFFEKYTVIFEAHNTMASIDYPLVFDDMSVRGISYIKNYLEHLDIETEFCNFFSGEDIDKILNGFGKMCRLNHTIELINIFELLINNSIFSVLCGNKAGQLTITKSQYDMINENLKGMNLTRINALINKAVETIITDLQISNSLLIEYINNYKELFIKRVLNALENNCLNSLIVVEYEDSKKYTFDFDEGKRMSEKSFNLTVTRIMKLSKVIDKIEVLNSEVHSLQDFIDILNSDCFFGEEFGHVFNTLSNIELTILAKLVFYEELRDELTDLSEIINSKREIEAEWQKHFIKFMEGLSEDKKKEIEKLLNEVDYEEIKFY